MTTVTIGRNPQNTIVVDNSYSTVSNYHATITETNGELRLQDHSTNGTYVNGLLCHNQSMVIHFGDNITLGKQYILPLRDVMQFLGLERGTQRYPQPPHNKGKEEPQMPPVNQRETPQCLNKWNWGAFILGWIWAIGNGVWWGLLGLIPYVSFVINIILGITGNKSAWEKYSGSAAEFDAKQESWTKAGLIVFVISFIAAIVLVVGMMDSY